MIIKEYYNGKEANLIILRRRNCGLNVQAVNELFKTAKVDFPNLNPEDAKIVHYGGRHYKGTFGIEFDMSFNVNVPSDYSLVSEPELVL